MVLDLCLPPFLTTIHCNKLCADGYDVTNLVSPDPAVRRRGFKLEYFLRPPVQVTLTFDFKVDICRVDVELWPWGMDRGQASKKLEISTCSDFPPTFCSNQTQQRKSQDNSQRKDVRPPQNNGHIWSAQAKDWSAEKTSEAQASTHQHRDSANLDFKLVGRCELREETKVCFSHSHFRSRPPFEQPPPPPAPNCRHESLWSRGVQSLGAVTQLRVALPFGGAASALGLKALSVWGQPARCCPTEQVEKIQKALEASERIVSAPAPVSVAPVRPLPKTTPASQSVSVPDEFLDPITQELMVLPMLLPSGVSVDHSTLDEYQKREATWGRPPKDPFTGVPFTSASQPLPNPQLKGRIDHFLLQTSPLCKPGRLGRRAAEKNPQPSRLVFSDGDVRMNDTFNNEQVRKRDFAAYSHCTSENSHESEVTQRKRPRNDPVLGTCSSHEQRLSVSLDEALSSALQGRPSFTSNLCLDSPLYTGSSQPQRKNALTPHGTTGTSSTTTGTSSTTTGTSSTTTGTTGTSTGTSNTTGTTGTSSTMKTSCSGCSGSMCVYATASSLIYRLLCGHFLCRSCLQTSSKPSHSAHVSCPSCHSLTPRSAVTRVHH